ncbi:putative disease resistance RPP13-like protein 1 [Vitis vinifera]|uniref:Putative disease resistance RPP13-like protein 1 n=1 Tax=Vitis vinifera TaxID=29760 RepID=A0A438IA15_VITVI|nr:putative disease resistance RPP13-like protein 1 [Vitis vinifera]
MSGLHTVNNIYCSSWQLAADTGLEICKFDRILYSLCRLQVHVLLQNMADALLSASLQLLFDRLASPAFINFLGRQNHIDELLSELKRKLLVVHKVLDDAEVKQFSNPNVKNWLVHVKDVVYDAEDLLDEIATDALRCKVEAADSQIGGTHKAWKWNKFSAWVKAPFATQSMESRVNGMIEKLVSIAQEKVGLGLKEGGGEKLSPRSSISTSLEDESLVFGRDEIQKEMADWLLSDNATGDNMEVMSIVGMGGSGKTTLARLLYNDDRVKEHFHLKAWVCVSTEFLLIKVTKSFLEEIGSKTDSDNLNKLQLELKDQLSNKKFLLVLDDVWDLKPRDWEGWDMEPSDGEGWDRLRTPLLAAAQGSKIVVTSRNESIATTMRAVQTRHLGQLSPQNCWRLFEKLAFEDRDSNAFLELEPIGRQIVDKCQGLPLAVKALGRLLHSKVEKREWENVLNSEIWHLRSGPEILPSLRLSYHHLSLPLKHCFAYCSIFPRNHEFDKEKLILLWMAEGLLHPQLSDRRRMEEIGESYFDELLAKSFFQKSIRKKGSCFVMHDLIHELAQHVSGDFCARVEDDDKANMKDKSYLDELILDWDDRCTDGVIQSGSTIHDILNKLLPHPNLKQLSIRNYPGVRFPNWLGNPLVLNLVSLELRGCGNCSTLPPLGQLTHLKYLQISRMNGVECVGSEFHGNASFQSLETLSFEDMLNWEKWLCCEEFPHLRKLSMRCCPKLTGKLPEQLLSLEELQIYNCPQLLMTSLTVLAIRELKMVNFGKLQLQMVACDFIALQTSEIEILDVSQWKQLPVAPHQLSIRKCDYVESLLEEEILQSNIYDLKIYDCSFSRSLHIVGLPTTLRSLSISQCSKLEFLLPELFRCHLPALQRLRIFGGVIDDSLSLSFSLDIFPELTHFAINGLKGLRKLFISISEGDPTSLCVLGIHIQECPNLESIELPGIKLEYCWISSCSKLRSLAAMHSSIQELCLWDCPELLFQREGVPSNLSELVIGNCNQLMPQMEWGLQRLTSLTRLRMEGSCADFELFPKECLLPYSLTCLEIVELPNLKSLDNWGLQQLTSLLELGIINCPELQFSTGSVLQHLISLKELRIDGCPRLQSLTEVGLQQLTSLERLYIHNCHELQYLTEVGLQHLTSLETLYINNCPKLQHLTKQRLQDSRGLQHLISLKYLGVENCPMLQSLKKDGLQHLTSLKALDIRNCRSVSAMSKAKGKAEAEDIMYKNRGISIEEDNIRKYTAPAYRAAEVERKTMLFDKHREKIEATGWELQCPDNNSESVGFRNGHHNKPATEATSGPETWDFGTESFYSHPCCQL